MSIDQDLSEPPLTEDKEGLFYFESDHLALKGNRDYSDMLKTIFLLEMQRSKGIQDFQKIIQLQEQALKKPNSFYKKVMNGEDLGIPEFQVIVEVPSIDFSKYPVELPNEALKFLICEPTEEKVKPEVPIKVDSEKDNKHDSTYKKSWSVEEQRRLEELLVTYPPEAVEFRRYKKIAAALGNRTVKQVSSRIQKYFLKLYKAGLPIPGRIPKNAEKAKKSKLHIHQRYNHLLFKPSTFFPQLDIPVVMNEAEVVPGPSIDVASSSNTNYNNYLVPSSTEHLKPSQLIEKCKSTVELQIEILKRVKLEKEKECYNDYPIQHIGYKCNYCDEEPISGIRWHCEICTIESIDFCSDCVVAQMYSREPHQMSHQLKPYSNETQMKSPYFSESTSEEETNIPYKNAASTGESSTSDGEVDGEINNVVDDIQLDEIDIKSKTFEDFMDCNQDNNIDVGEHNTDQFFNFEQDSDPYFNDISASRDSLDLDSKDGLLDDNIDSFTDAQNLSYSYLHSNLLLDDN